MRSLWRGDWRRGACLWSIAAFVTFAVNLACTISAITSAPVDEFRDGAIRLTTGSCGAVRNLDTGLHLLINALSTVLLAGSNYCMQCACGPTRDQVDAAHRQLKWLDIGIPSFRNLAEVGKKNKRLWLLLGLSSLPLHLFYNSVVFSSISANVYNVWSLNESILHSPNLTAYLGSEDLAAVNVTADLAQTVADFGAGLFTNLTVEQCIESYAQTFQSSWGDVILISNSTARTDWLATSDLAVVDRFNLFGAAAAYQWICAHSGSTMGSQPCDGEIPRLLAHADDWAPYGMVVDYCYARQTSEACNLYFNPIIAIVVVILNLSKAVLMCLVAYDRRKPLLTVGDAVASFMQRPDKSTAGMCLADKQHFSQTSATWWRATNIEFGDNRKRRFLAVSLTRWFWSILAYLTGLGVAGYFLSAGIVGVPGARDWPTLASLGIGAATERTLVSYALSSGAFDPLLGNVMVANLPQLILSVMYFTYNGLFTAMCAAVEWSRFAIHRKGLRVSSAPVGSQRSTYFLQLPYRYSLVLMVFSGTLHWLFSQSLFLVSVEAASSARNPVATYGQAALDRGTFFTCGWSPLAVTCSMSVVGALVVFLVLWSLRRLPTGMPAGASCSAVIAAACHPEPWEKDAWERPLQWGATVAAGAGSGHCSFSSEAVAYPVRGEIYR